VEYERGGDNPNEIYNAYNFYYSHYNVDDNLHMTEMQRNNYKNSRAPGTAGHDQDIIGLRRSAEGAIYDAFTSDNVFYGDIKDFDWTGKLRTVLIDPGFNHPTGMLDAAVDLLRGEIWFLQERLIDFKVEYIGQKSLATIYMEYLKIIRNAKERESPEYTIIDPSKPELIEFIQNFGFSVYEANNQNWSTDRKDKEISEEITARELRGIPLAQTAFAKNKIHVHESCTNLIHQIGSYAYIKDDKSGKDKLPKLNDDLVVLVKYAVNTLGIRPSMWSNEDEEIENGKKNVETSLSRNGNEESKEQYMERLIATVFGQPTRNFYEEQESIFSNGNDDFFS